MNLSKKFLIGTNFIIFYSLAFTSVLLGLYQKKAMAFPVNIPPCTGSIPVDDSCLVNPTSYEVDIYKVLICQNDPFPSNANKANLSSCMKLFESNNPYTGQLAQNQFTLPSTGRDQIKEGQYSYVAVVFSNVLTGAGSYTSGGKTYRTTGNGSITTDPGDPVKHGETFTGWRGEFDDDNDYCRNGATQSRCETDFNNYQVTGIITDSSLNSVSGNSASRLFYLAELTSPFTLSKSSSGSIEINVDNAYELNGSFDGSSVDSMAIAPFVFQPTFVNN